MYKKITILLVEDCKELSQSINLLLCSQGYNVELAMTVSEGIEKLKLMPEIILLDRNLPDQKGDVLCKAVRSNPDFSHISIIMLTAMTSFPDKVDGLYMGADDYMTKPFDTDELLARINALLRRKQKDIHTVRNEEALYSNIIELINNKGIIPVYQPIFNIKKHEIFGYEVMSKIVRESQFESSEQLFDLAQRFGQYFDLQKIVWTRAIDMWNQQKKSGKLFLNCKFDILEQEFNQCELIINKAENCGDIILEITERSTVPDIENMINIVSKLQVKGVGIAIDDVGSGYSSLDMVAEVKPDYIKINMSIVRNIDKDKFRFGVIQSVGRFCKKTGVKIIAEGVETQSELDALAEIGIPFAQGNFLSKPVITFQSS